MHNIIMKWSVGGNEMHFCMRGMKWSGHNYKWLGYVYEKWSNRAVYMRDEWGSGMKWLGHNIRDEVIRVYRVYVWEMKY